MAEHRRLLEVERKRALERSEAVEKEQRAKEAMERWVDLPVDKSTRTLTMILMLRSQKRLKRLDMVNDLG
jgi:RNA polymerase-binding transcription factor DksA